MKTCQIKIFSKQCCFTTLREVGTVNKQDHVSIIHDIECTYKIQWYTIYMLSLSVLDIVTFIILNAKKWKLFRGHLFSNAVKTMLFISDAWYYVPVKLCRTPGSIHLFKITRKLIPEHVNLKKKYTMGCYN